MITTTRTGMEPAGRRRRSPGAIALLVGLMALCLPAAAQKASPSDAKELTAYQLTMDKIERFTALQEGLARLLKEDPEFREIYNSDDDEEGGASLPPIDKAAARLSQLPAKFRKLVAANGFALREAVVLGFAYVVNSWGALERKNGKKALPSGASEANVQFLLQNQGNPVLKRLVAAINAQQDEESEESEEEEK